MFELYRNFILSLPTKELKDSFSNLPDDQYLKENFNFRKRRFSRCMVSDTHVTWLEEENFYQSININNYLGDVSRKYQELERSTKNHLEQGLLKKIKALFPDKKLQMGVHQMRTVANNTYSARPAPEGIHQDGYDFVGIYSVQESNINGGVSILVNNKNHEDVVFEKRLSSGEFCIFNDRDLAHYVTPFTPKYPGEANRDVFVFTIELQN